MDAKFRLCARCTGHFPSMLKALRCPKYHTDTMCFYTGTLDSSVPSSAIYMCALRHWRLVHVCFYVLDSASNIWSNPSLDHMFERSPTPENCMFLGVESDPTYGPVNEASLNNSNCLRCYQTQLTLSRLLKFVAFFISCLAKFVAGAVFVFFVYQDDVKQTFNYSQKEVELLASMIVVGMGLGFVPGMFFDRFGPRLTSVIGLVLSAGSYFLIWSTTYNLPFYRTRIWLMAIYFLFSGFGAVFTLMVTTNTNVMNFDKRHSGKVLGILNTFFAGSPSIFATIYYNLFTDDSATKAEKDNFSGFMLMLAVSFAAANLLCIIFVGKYDDQSDQTLGKVDQVNENNPSTNSVNNDAHRGHGSVENSENCDDNTDNAIRTDTGEEQGNNESNSASDGDITATSDEDTGRYIPILKLLLNIDYQLLIWTSTLAVVVSLVYGMNITIMSKSVGLDHYNNILGIILPVTNAVVSPCIGIFSDYFKKYIPRLVIIIFGCACFTGCTLIIVIFPDEIASLMIASVFCGAGVAIIFSITPTLMKEMFGIKNFGRNWGIAMCLQAIIGMPSQIVFGLMYDNQIKTEGEIDCYGSACMVGGMSIFLGLSLVSVLLGVIMLYKDLLCRILCSRRSHYNIANS